MHFVKSSRVAGHVKPMSRLKSQVARSHDFESLCKLAAFLQAHHSRRGLAAYFHLRLKGPRLDTIPRDNSHQRPTYLLGRYSHTTHCYSYATCADCVQHNQALSRSFRRLCSKQMQVRSHCQFSNLTRAAACSLQPAARWQRCRPILDIGSLYLVMHRCIESKVNTPGHLYCSILCRLQHSLVPEMGHRL
jgi:hypothetical protein